MLEEAKQEGEEILKLLLLPTETTETPGGLTVKNTTLLDSTLALFSEIYFKARFYRGTI
jgi:hypothetical protein